MKKYILLTLGLAFLFIGCDSLDKVDPIPAYIYVPGIELASKPFFGSVKQDFTEVYAYVDGELLGAFPIPAIIPILATGDHTISIFAGIHKFGIKSAGDVYPVLDKYEIPLNLVAGKIDTIMPVVHYRDDVTVGLLEEFEGNSNIFTAKYTGDGFVKDNSDPYEGDYSGALLIDTIEPLIEVGTVDMELPKTGTRIYVELNYKNDVEFVVGIQGINNSADTFKEYIVVLRPSEEWMKVYIDITDQVLFYNYKYYKVLIQTGLPLDGNGFKVNTGKVLIDNFKVVY